MDHGNATMRLLVVMVMLKIMPKLVAVQNYEAFPPSNSHPHPPPLLIPARLLSPATTPPSFPPLGFPRPDISSPPPLDRFERFIVAKCVVSCAIDCYRLHKKRDPGTFTYCFGDCAKDVCGTYRPSFAMDCTSRCSDSINTNYELDMDEAEGYMAKCYDGCGGNH